MSWTAGAGNQGVAELVTIAPGSNVELRSDNSTIIEFFGNDNWELLLKILDARVFNQHFWIYLASASSVGYDVNVVDTVCHEQRTYSGVRGTFQPATTDTTAFAAECDDPAPPSCIPSDGVICLGGGRFQVEVTWLGFDDNTGIGRQVVIADGGPAQSNDSGLFAFFEPNNWEMLVKVLDGCDINDHFWVFKAATTDLGFTLSVTDTETVGRVLARRIEPLRQSGELRPLPARHDPEWRRARGDLPLLGHATLPGRGPARPDARQLPLHDRPVIESQ